ncbi:MAG: T9SS type A sorting domain-containing protein [Flavobacteriaceae bacterium]
MRIVVLLPMLFLCFKGQSQFIDHMESYTVGEQIYEGHWTDFNCGGSCALYASDDVAHSGSISGFIPGDTTTDGVLDLGNKIFGTWLLEFWMYVPSGKEAFFSILGSVPSEPPNIGYFYFNQGNNNPGQGFVQDVAIGDVSFSFPHDEWFRIVFWVDISLGIQAAKWQLYIDNVEVIPCETPFTNEFGTYPTSLGGVEFFSISSNTAFYIDDFLYWDPPVTCDLNIEDKLIGAFNIYPNPVNEILTIEKLKNIEIKSLNIYDVSGRLVETKTSNFYQIMVSYLKPGIYFLKINTENGTITQEFIKK